MISSPRRAFCAVVAATSLAMAVPALAVTRASATDGTVSLVARSAAVGVGYEWGGGTLHYHGHSYPFSVKGLSVAAVGFSRIAAHGRVLNLHRISDFAGTYASSTGQLTVSSGVIGQALVNGQGVQIRLDGATKGAELSGSADGVQIELQR